MAGVATPPIKGSAVLWFNLDRASELDEMTWHASCPVILGEKWSKFCSFFRVDNDAETFAESALSITVANMWILNYDQMFHPNYRCSLDPNDSVEFFVNGRSISSI